MDPQYCKVQRGQGRMKKVCRFYLIGILNIRKGYTNLRISSFVISISNDGDHV